MRWAVPLAWSVVGVSLCGLVAGLLQRPMAEGVIAVHLEPGGRMRLWHQPITPAALSGFLAAAARRQPPPRLRLVPDPQLPWGEVRRAMALLDRASLPLELQLPAPVLHR